MLLKLNTIISAFRVRKLITYPHNISTLIRIYLYFLSIFFVICVVMYLKLICIILLFARSYEPYTKYTPEHCIHIRRVIERNLAQSLKEDNGTGCDIPKLDPFANEIKVFDKNVQPLKCEGETWVQCYLSKCKVTREVLRKIPNVKCSYRNIIYYGDYLNYVSEFSTDYYGDNVYVLKSSDHALVNCSGTKKDGDEWSFEEWSGVVAGFRTYAMPPKVPSGREDSINVLIFALESTSRNGFIRRMPRSYYFLKSGLKATILTGYSVVGDATVASILPLLTGKTEWDWPENRKDFGSKPFDTSKLIFHKVKQKGYRTAYFEDRPDIGTFQFRFNGFASRPADHYLNDYFKQVNLIRGDVHSNCIGGIPQHEFLMNITEQFFHLDGKKFCFTFVGNLGHGDYNMITNADGDFVKFLRYFRDNGFLKNTLLVVMGDHGVRYSSIRSTYQGKLEHLLPLMAIVLPEQLIKKRPDIEMALKSNEDVLTTPHDIHATILDALDMREHWNPYKIEGAVLTRELTLFKTIPRRRSCSEAGIESHWCVCKRWAVVPRFNAMYRRISTAVVDYINSVTQHVRYLCAERTLNSVTQMLIFVPNKKMIMFTSVDGYNNYNFLSNNTYEMLQSTLPDIYQVQLELSPNNAKYEATITYNKIEDKIVVDARFISRINAYGNESICISQKIPELARFCYCI